MEKAPWAAEKVEGAGRKRHTNGGTHFMVIGICVNVF